MTSPTLLGLDIGGSSVKYQLASLDAGAGSGVLSQDTIETPMDEPLAGLARMARTVAAGTHLEGVTVAIPGLVDEVTGTVLRSVNIPALDGLALGPALSRELGVPVGVVNDGRAAALAEANWGAGAAFNDVFTLALGTGIAGCHIVNGAVAPGAHGIAGELGHVVIEPNGELCACGQRGCLEMIIGAPALRRAFAAVGGQGSPRDLIAAYDDGDARAIPVVERAANALGDALLTLMALVDPGCIVIGGGLASEPHRLVLLAAERVRAKATFHNVPPILPAELGRWAGATGCVGIAREALTARLAA